MNNVVKFPYSVSRRVHSRKSRRSKNGTPEQRALGAAATVAMVSGDQSSETVTYRNGCLRKERDAVWQKAEAATRYWRVRIDFFRAVDSAQRRGVVEAHDHEQWSREEDQRTEI
jgi:hypothetical protein